jgi:hypothetical protein
MDREEALARIADIQRVMERATRYTVLPGGAAVVGGLLVLAGCALSYGMLHSLDFAALLTLPLVEQTVFCLLWLAIGAAGISLELILTARTARREGLSTGGRPSRGALVSLSPRVLIAMLLTYKFLAPQDPRPEEVQYIVPLWMMLYGTGVFTVGQFSLRAPRLLGLAFIAAGAVAMLLFQAYGVLAAALSFGLFHIVFGLHIIAMRRRGAP